MQSCINWKRCGCHGNFARCTCVHCLLFLQYFFGNRVLFFPWVFRLLLWQLLRSRSQNISKLMGGKIRENWCLRNHILDKTSFCVNDSCVAWLSWKIFWGCLSVLVCCRTHWSWTLWLLPRIMDSVVRSPVAYRTYTWCSDKSKQAWSGTFKKGTCNLTLYFLSL